jgi:hypothetical protein
VLWGIERHDVRHPHLVVRAWKTAVSVARVLKSLLVHVLNVLLLASFYHHFFLRFCLVSCIDKKFRSRSWLFIFEMKHVKRVVIRNWVFFKVLWIGPFQRIYMFLASHILFSHKLFLHRGECQLQPHSFLMLELVVLRLLNKHCSLHIFVIRPQATCHLYLLTKGLFTFYFFKHTILNILVFLHDPWGQKLRQGFLF